MIPFINRVVKAEPQHNDAVNLKISIISWQNGASKPLLYDLFMPDAAVILLLFCFPLELQFFGC